jgi:copper chaperone
MQLETETLSVPEIHCDHCKQSIEGALSPLAGVSNAVVDIPNATVTVSYEAAQISRETLVSTIEEQGFTVPSSPDQP